MQYFRAKNLAPAFVICAALTAALVPAALHVFETHLLGQEKQSKSGGDNYTKLAPYFPTPEIVVDRMLQLGGLKAGEKMYDLGSGDGRIVIMAARKYRAQAVGVELDESLYKQSMQRIRTLGLEPRA